MDEVDGICGVRSMLIVACSSLCLIWMRRDQAYVFTGFEWCGVLEIHRLLCLWFASHKDHPLFWYAFTLVHAPSPGRHALQLMQRTALTNNWSVLCSTMMKRMPLRRFLAITIMIAFIATVTIAIILISLSPSPPSLTIQTTCTRRLCVALARAAKT